MNRKQKKSYSLNDFLEYPNRALRLASFKPFNEEHKKFSVLSRLLMIIGPIVSTAYFIGMIIPLFKLEDDSIPIILQISDKAAPAGLVSLSICKICMLFLYRKEMTILIAELDKFFPGNLKLNHSFQKCEYKLEQFYEFSRSLMRTLFILLSSIGGILNILRFVQSSVEYLVMGQNFIYRLPTATWFQWDENSLLNYISVYLFQLYCSVHLVSYHMAGDFLLCFLLTQMRMHYEFIVTFLETIDAAEAEKDPNCLKFLINYHLRLNSMVKKINEIFDVSFLINFAMSSIAMCLMGYSMIMGLSFGDIAAYSMGLFTFFLFTLFICYNGSKLTESSDKLLLAAFYHNWYDAGPFYKKTILLFMIGSAKPRILQAYKFAPVSMQTFMNILKFSYQLFTCFRAI